MPSHPRSCSHVLFLFLLLHACVARGQIESTEELLVKQGYRTAEELRSAGDLVGARRVLQKTYEQVPTPLLLWPMAELDLQLKRPESGLQALHTYVERVPPERMPTGRQMADVALLEQKLIREQMVQQQLRMAPRRRGPGLVHWIIGGAGVASVIAGAVLLGLNGHQSCPVAPYCAQQLSTLPAGAAVLSAGLTAAGISALTIGLAYRRVRGRDPLLAWSGRF